MKSLFSVLCSLTCLFLHSDNMIASACTSLNEPPPAPELQQFALSFLATFLLVVTLLSNNRHTVFVIFYSCSFHLPGPFT